MKDSSVIKRGADESRVIKRNIHPVSMEYFRNESSKRYVKMDNIDVEDLKNEGYVKEFNGYYLAKSRYSRPLPGRYSIYIHGGLSLMECFVPVPEVEK